MNRNRTITAEAIETAVKNAAKMFEQGYTAIQNSAVPVAELEADARALHSRFNDELKAWAFGECERRRRKTVTLLDGSLLFRTAPAKLVIADGEAAFVHARTAFAHCIKEQMTVTLDTAAYLAEAEKTGELLPGLDAVPEWETFKIDTSGPKGKGRADLSA